MPNRTPLLPVALFVSAYMLGALVLAFSGQNWEFLVYIAVVLIIGAVIYALHRRVNFSRGVLWCLGLWGLLHMVGGLIHVPAGWPISGDKDVFYSLWIIPGLLKYDMIVHAFGFAVATWATWQAAGHILSRKLPDVAALTLCVLAGMGLGALNEIIEFLTTLLVPNTNVGGYVNTGWDLIANFTGSLIAALIIGFGPRKK